MILRSKLQNYFLLGLIPVFFGAAGAFSHAEDMPRNLNQIEKKITASKKALAAQEEEKKKLAAELLAVGAELQDSQNKLAELKKQQERLAAEKKVLQVTLKRAREEVQKIAASMANLVNQQYKRQYPNALAILMKNDDLNTKTRNLTYLKYLEQEEKRIYLSYVEKSAELERLREELDAKEKKLAALAKEEERHHFAIKRQEARKLVLKKQLDTGIVTTATNLQRLESAEAKLNARIQRVLIEQRQSPVLAGVSVAPQAAGNLTAEDLRLTEAHRGNIVDSSEALASSAFLAYKGQLSLPARGVISRAYGERRADGNIIKGIVIDAPEGSRVQSVAPGVVMYVGEMPNFGKTVIIAHDQVYASIYTGLSAVNVARGEKVKKDSPLGKSGILYNGSPGIYFELRENSRAINPKSWFQ